MSATSGTDRWGGSHLAVVAHQLDGPLGLTHRAAREEPGRARLQIDDGGAVDRLEIRSVTGFSPEGGQTVDVESPVAGFSHVQLQVRDVSASREWYETVIGMEAFVELSDTIALRHRPSRLVIVLSEGDADQARSPLDHLAFAVPDGEVLQQWADHLSAAGIAHPGVVLELGKPSLQLRDPDGNSIELVAPVPRQ